MMKKPVVILVSLLLLCNIALQAQQRSMADSVIYYLRQVKGLQSRDSVILGKAVAAIKNTPAATLPVGKIDSELKKLLPVIHRQNCLAVKFNVACGLISGRDIGLTIEYDKNLISELKGYSNEFEKNILLNFIEWSRIPYRNTTRQDEGISYYQHLANDFEMARDSAATSACYWSLGGLYRTVGLTDKAIYCNMKSIAYHNKYYVLKGKNFLVDKYDKTDLGGYINKVGNLANNYVDCDEPKKAFPFLYEAKNMIESTKDSVELKYVDYIYFLIAKAKMLTGGDSVDYYLDLHKKLTELRTPTISSAHYQAYGYYCFLHNRMDSAEYFILRAAEIKKNNAIWINSTSDVLIPGYYLALIKTRQHKYSEAIRLLKDEINDLLKVNLRTVTLKELKLLADAYKMDNDFKNSTAVWEQYYALQNKILDDENRSRSMSFETEQQISSLNVEKQKQEQEASRQKLIRNWITGGLAIVFIFSLIFLLQRIRIAKEKRRSEALLLNILPYETARELKVKGKSEARMFDEVTVMFTDFKGFTQISEKLSPAELVAEIDTCFKAFDEIITKYNIEKIKTIGDSYMCAGGLPVPNKTNAADVINAGLEIRDFMLRRRSENSNPGFEIRIGVHTGPVIAGIVGNKKFAYDIWGDTVNVASRMESSGEVGKVNISNMSYDMVKDQFIFIKRGKIQAKYKGEIDMYFVESIR
jgi:class 3 adenylate cyclase